MIRRKYSGKNDQFEGGWNHQNLIFIKIKKKFDDIVEEQLCKLSMWKLSYSPVAGQECKVAYRQHKCGIPWWCTLWPRGATWSVTNKGPRTEPCGTPQLTNTLDILYLNAKHCESPEKYWAKLEKPFTCFVNKTSHLLLQLWLYSVKSCTQVKLLDLWMLSNSCSFGRMLASESIFLMF